MRIFAAERTGPFSGGPVRCFTTKEKAIEWLASQSTAAPMEIDGEHFIVNWENPSGRWRTCYAIREIEVH